MRQHNDRIIFLDNVRTMVVMFVVILHAACAYAEIIPWWPVQEFPKELPYSVIILVFDLFCMPTLFFIAGYFAPASFRRNGAWGFIKTKLRRLGVPFVFLSVFYVPIMSYVGYRGRTEQPLGFFDYWLFQLSTAWKPKFVLLDSVEKAAPHANDFSQWHLWFITLLFLFFLAYAIAARIWPALAYPAKSPDATEPSKGATRLRAAERSAMGEVPVGLGETGFSTDHGTQNTGRVSRASRYDTTSREVLASLLITGLVSTMLVSITNMAIPDWSWANIGGYFLAQPTRLGTYCTLFWLGVLAAHRGWFTRASFPGPLWVWLTVALILDMVFFAILEQFMKTMGPAPLPLAMANGALRSFACLAWLAVLLKIAQRWLKSPHALRAALSRSSYDIYLLHLPVVVGLQLVATTLPLDYFVKFLLIIVCATALCFFLSRELVQARPRRALALLLAVFLTACVVLG